MEAVKALISLEIEISVIALCGNTRIGKSKWLSSKKSDQRLSSIRVGLEFPKNGHFRGRERIIGYCR